LAWLRDWLRRREPQGLEVKGLFCQAPARLRGLAVGELRGEMDECEAPGGKSGSTGGKSGSTVEAKSTGVGSKSTGVGSKSTGSSPAVFWVESAPGGSVKIRWSPAPPGASFRLSWFRSGAGSVTETLVRGERGEYVVGGLEPRGAYRVCLSPLDPSPLP
ncbi:FLRT1 protein, partial [Chordeiles acutipennis]|nr:FLRT1 protein [Chordeiles acutipennis]